MVLHPIAELGGGALAVRRGDEAWVVVDPSLHGPTRRAAITHELVHLARGPLPTARDAPPTWAAVIAREERLVDTEVARRLVPPTELEAALVHWHAMGEAVTPELVADAFDTTVAVAVVALATRCPPSGRGRQSAGSESRNERIADHHAAGASNWGL